MNDAYRNPFREVNERLQAAIGKPAEPSLERQFDLQQTPEDVEFLRDMHIEAGE